MELGPEEPTSTSTFTWKTTSCSHARSRWNGDTEKERKRECLRLPHELRPRRVGRSHPRRSSRSTRARETGLSRLLVLFITTGLVFMLLPGTFLGVWNLLAISRRHAADSVSAGWVQAHGHAQIFGWIGTFILGIGFYSLPKLRRMLAGNRT
jgi:hypothetical protein